MDGGCGEAEVNLSESYILRDSLAGVVQESHLEDCVQDLCRLTKEGPAPADSACPLVPFCDTDGMTRMAFAESKSEAAPEPKTGERRAIQIFEERTSAYFFHFILPT